MTEAFIERNAFGRIAQLGQFYDARSDKFCGTCNLFKTAIPANLMTVTDKSTQSMDYSYDSSTEEKFEILRVTGELKVSVLCGLFQLSGHGEYLNEKKKNTKTISGSLVFSGTSRIEQVNVFTDQLHTIVSSKALEQVPDATHVVTQIDWGANAIITMNYTNKDNRDTNTVKGNLQAYAEKIKKALDIGGKVDVNVSETDVILQEQTRIKFFVDAFPIGKEFPQTMQESMEYVKLISAKLGVNNEGKGVPLRYYFTPIGHFRRCFAGDLNIERLVYKIEEDTIRRVTDLFDEFDETLKTLYDLDEEIKNNVGCISNDVRQKVNRKLKASESAMANLRSTIADLTVKIRAGKSSIRELNAELDNFMESEFRPSAIQEFVDDHDELREKLNYVTDLKQSGVNYIGKGKSLETELRPKERRFPCIAVDVDVFPGLAKREGVPEGPRICLYSNGRYENFSVNSEKPTPKFTPCDAQIDLIYKLQGIRKHSKQPDQPFIQNDHRWLRHMPSMIVAGNITERNALKTERCKQILLSFDRADFCPTNPYEDHPQGVGFNTTISAPHMHAMTLEFFIDKIHSDSKVLDVGCGSGYLTTCFAKMIGITGKVIGIDHIPELVELAKKNIKKHHLDLYNSGHIKIVEGDGRRGYFSEAPYDVINVGAAAEKVPQPLLDQLEIGGRLIMPVGPPGDQHFTQYDKISSTKIDKKILLGVRYVPLTSKEAQLKGNN